jgi:aldehyde:ferredoxin oxidoreductase
MYSYGKLISFDLTENQKEVKSFDGRIIRYLGADGWGARLLNDLVPAGIDPLSSSNVLIVIPGLLCGSPIPTSGKTGFFSKSPLTNGWGESWIGSGIGIELKQAGIGALIIKGKAPEPSFLSIDEEQIEVRGCKDLWGKDTQETPEELKRKLGKEFVIASIGIGGENKVRFAGIDCEHRQAGRGGMGAVMGSKQLKAIAVHGTQGLTFAQPKRLIELGRKWYKETRKAGNWEADEKYGSGEFLEWVNKERGTFPTRNWDKGVFKKRKELDPYYWVKHYSIKNKACLACSKPCGKVFVMKEGRAETKVDGPDYETLFALGSNLENPSIEAIAKMNELCDRYGLDTISTGGVLGFAMDLFEHKILNKEDTKGIELKFGSIDGAIELIELIAHRKGIGNLLAEGVRRATKLIGKGAQRYAIEVGGMEPPGYDPRGLKGMALAFMTSPRGACHVRSCAYGAELTGKFWKFEGVDRFSCKNKGKEIAQLEDLMSCYDSLGLCKFSRSIFLDNFEDILEAVVGKRYKKEEILKKANETNNLKHEFNLKCGWKKANVALPWKFTNLPIPEGPSVGSFVGKEEAQKMLEDYFAVRGLDKRGIPKESDF